jgi:hypothetical protein
VDEKLIWRLTILIGAIASGHVQQGVCILDNNSTLFPDAGSVLS